MSVFKSEPIPFQLEDVMGQYIFFLIKSAPILLIGWDFLKISDAHIYFSQKGEMYLELNESDIKPVGKIMILKETKQEERWRTQWVLSLSLMSMPFSIPFFP